MGRTRYAASGGLRIAYELHGSVFTARPTLLLVQGLGFDSSGWGAAIGHLRRRFRLVLVDNRAHVLGASLGGMIAQDLAIRHPERVDKLVLACTTPGWPFAYPMILARQRSAAGDPAVRHRQVAAGASYVLPGVSAALLDDSGEEISEGAGVLVLTQPWPSMLRTLYGDPDRFVQTYFSQFGPSVYFVGDGARRDEDGYFWITGRIDDVINVSGHRLSTAEIESALVAHPAVAEAAVIAAGDDLTGQAVWAYVTLGGGSVGDDRLETELREYVAGRIGKLARPKRIIWAEDLPKTRSGKIMRRLLRDIAEGREPGDATTLRDTSVLGALQRAAISGGTG